MKKLNRVYKVNLYSIPKNIKIDESFPKELNIILSQEANKINKALTILVTPTLSRKYYKEIITKRLIPAMYYKASFNIEGSFPYLTNNSEVFVDELDILLRHTEATVKDVENYIKTYKNKDVLANKLNTIFENAARWYNEADEKVRQQKNMSLENEKNIKKLVIKH